jgi:LacI family transcriptional regulator
MKRVALLIETSRAYGRGLLRGIARYNREEARWSLYYQPHGLDDPPPAWLRRWKGDGVLARIGDRACAGLVLRLGVPVVDLRAVLPDLDVPLIEVDNREVAELAVDHLRQRGFRHFGFCGLARGTWKCMDARCDCFRQLVEAAGFSCSVFQSRRAKNRGEDWETQQNEIAGWVRSLPKPVGLMASNDDRGLQLLDACRRADVIVPEEAAVVSVDNDEYLCGLAIPPLSSIDVNPEQIGYQAAALLDRMMAGERPPDQPLLIAPRGVVTRQSTDVLASDDPKVVQALAFIRANACQRIRVVDVVAHVHLSRASLEPRMKEATGRTIHDEIHRVQIEEVKTLLSSSNLTLKQIARRCGFTYTQYMARAFRQATGQTLTQYRKVHSPKDKSGTVPVFARAKQGQSPSKTGSYSSASP